MLTMKRMPEADKQALLRSLGLNDEETFIYEAKEGEQRIGYAVFQNKDQKPTVVYAEYGGDESLLDGLIRSGMAWMDDNHLTCLYFSDELDQAPLKRLGFLTDDKKYVDSIENFLKTCKKCRM